MDTLQQVVLILWLLLLLIGLILAFAGRWVFESLMSFLGAILGAAIGFDIGYNRLNWGCLGGLIFCVIGALIGGLIFHFIVEFAIALFCGLLAAGVVLVVMGTGGIIIAIIVAVVVAALAWYFIKEIIGVVTALMGGMLSGYALLEINMILGWGMQGIMILLALLIFIGGAIIQVSAAKSERGRGKPPKEPEKTAPEPKSNHREDSGEE